MRSALKENQPSSVSVRRTLLVGFARKRLHQQQLHLKQHVIPILVLMGEYAKKLESTRTLTASVLTLALRDVFVMWTCAPSAILTLDALMESVFAEEGTQEMDILARKSNRRGKTVPSIPPLSAETFASVTLVII